MNTQVLYARKGFRLSAARCAIFLTVFAAIAAAAALVAAARDNDFYLYLCAAVALTSIHAADRFDNSRTEK